MEPILHSRLALVALTVLGLGGLLTVRPAGTLRPPDAVSPTGVVSPSVDPSSLWLDRLLSTAPTASDWLRVEECLLHGPWPTAELAMRVFVAHGQPVLAGLQEAILERAMHDRPRTFRERTAWRTVLKKVLDELDPEITRRSRELLVDLARSGSEGELRARALQRLTLNPPAEWESLVLQLLNDPSQRVRLVAADIAVSHAWQSAVPRLEEMARSPRPLLAARGAQALARLGKPGPSGSPDVLPAASELAAQLKELGLDCRDILPNAANCEDERNAAAELARVAESRLDQAASPETKPDGEGVLLLAWAVELGHDKLARRLWLREVSSADSDADLLERGLCALARRRILAGLARYRIRDVAGAIRELAAVAPLARRAAPWSALEVYVEHAAELSASIWQEASHPTRSGTEPMERGTEAILRDSPLDQLLFDPEAHRRLDAWCGLSESPTLSVPSARGLPLAN